MAAVTHIRSRSQELGAKVNVSMFTNAMLVTDDMARFLAENQVFLIVSLDGRPERHDQARCNSYQQVRENILLCQRHGCRIGVSMVLSKFNQHTIVEDLKHVLDEFHPVDLGINCTLHGADGKDNPQQVDPAEGTALLIECYKLLRSQGIYFEHLLRRVRPFVLKQPRLRDCPAGGGKMVFVPGGKVGVCEAFAASGRYFLDQDTFSFAHPMVEEWKQRSPLGHDSCLSCPGVGVCGGGCGYDADNRHGTLGAMGDNRCVQTRVIMDWVLQDLGDRLELGQQGYAIPGLEQRKWVLENMAMHDGTLPMHNYSTFGEDGHR